MDFQWIQKNDGRLVLMGHEQAIAVLTWVDKIEMWYLESGWLDISSDIEGPSKEQIPQVEDAALETLIEHCKEQMDWYQGQIEELEEKLKCSS